MAEEDGCGPAVLSGGEEEGTEKKDVMLLSAFGFLAAEALRSAALCFREDMLSTRGGGALMLGSVVGTCV